jgi:hypothetical protein
MWIGLRSSFVAPGIGVTSSFVARMHPPYALPATRTIHPTVVKRTPKCAAISA